MKYKKIELGRGEYILFFKESNVIFPYRMFEALKKMFQIDENELASLIKDIPLYRVRERVEDIPLYFKRRIRDIELTFKFKVYEEYVNWQKCDIALNTSIEFISILDAGSEKKCIALDYSTIHRIIRSIETSKVLIEV